jgi:DNA invertase Pin-like site-specific DNA recombinase
MFVERKISKLPIKTPAAPKLTRVAAYARVSSGKDAALHSLSAQVSYYSDFIQKHKGWTYCGVYSDECLTGTKDSREGFQQLLADCRAGRVDLVITKSISRFARNTVDLLNVVRELKNLGIAVFFEEQGINTLTGDGELMLSILASYAQEESLSTSENTKWRIKRDFEQGKMPMSQQRLYGFRRTADGGYRIEQTEAEVIRRIFRRYLAGAGMLIICRELNEDGIPAPKGERWNAHGLRYILSNEKAMGDLKLQKSYVSDHIEKRKIINRGEKPQYYVENNHVGIIDRDTFTAVQEELQRRAARYKATGEPQKKYSFTGLITCGSCGSHYKRKKGAGRFYWQCGTYLQHGKAACSAKQIPEEVLETLTAEVGGVDKIKEIIVPADFRLVFALENGAKIEREWQYKSRAESWTNEMKAQAAEHSRRGRAN